MNNRILVRRGFLLAGWVVLLQLSGCALLPTGGGDASAVWSEDGRGIAFVSRVDQPKPGYRVAVQNPDGTARRVVVKYREEGVGALYYLREAGYLVAEALRTDGWQQFDRIHLDGGEIPILEVMPPDDLCPDPKQPPAGLARHQILPAPDGKLIAHGYSDECGSVLVELLRASDLIALNAHHIQVTAPAQLTWHPVGYLLLVEPTTGKAWRMHVNEAPNEVAYPGCIEPPTASGPVSREGKRASVRGGEVKITPVKPDTLIFGCQLSVP